jgi:tetratricopeptide (TPR) repeat protein
MAGPLAITLEPPKALPATAEARLLLDALARQPDSPRLRSKLGKVLNQLDRFEETIALLEPALGLLDCDTALTLAQACFALREADHLDLARAAADRARDSAKSAAQQARAMADQAKVQSRLGNDDAALAILRSAMELDRRSVAAFKRLSVQLLRQGDPELVVRLTAGLIADGICHARVLSARVTALAATGRIEQAQAASGLARFLHCAPITPPPGWESLELFNAELVAELTANAALRLDRFGTASTRTWRLDAPTASETPLWQLLLGQIARSVEVWANGLSGTDHPWLGARPQHAVLRSWCVMTGAEGHELWHMHPDGWLSGGYYPLVPPVPGSDGNKPGHLAFGLPDGLPGAASAKRFGEVTVKPEAGLLTLFPSHAYHRTYPHGTAERRICVAFDVIPV